MIEGKIKEAPLEEMFSRDFPLSTTEERLAFNSYLKKLNDMRVGFCVKHIGRVKASLSVSKRNKSILESIDMTENEMLEDILQRLTRRLDPDLFRDIYTELYNERSPGDPEWLISEYIDIVKGGA